MAELDWSRDPDAWRFTVAGSRAADREAIEDWGLPGLVLMEHAALAVVQAVMAEAAGRQAAIGETDRPARVLVLAGGGNNGGDGWATARLLDHRRRTGRGGAGAAVDVMTVADPPETGDAALQARLARRLELDAGPLAEADPADIVRPDVIVDAMIGIGLTRPLGDRVARAARLIAGWRAAGSRVLAVDVPSGLDADRGCPVARPPEAGAVLADPPAVAADVTVSFHGRKTGYDAPGAEAWTGRVVVGDVGVPEPILRRHATRRAEHG